jgi:hypothetical protein
VQYNPAATREQFDSAVLEASNIETTIMKIENQFEELEKKTKRPW